MFLFLFQALVQVLHNVRQSILECSHRAQRYLVSHQDADLVDLLPLVFQGKKGPYLEVARRDIDGLRDLTPVVEVPGDLPIFVAIVDDKQVATGRAGPCRQRIPQESLGDRLVIGVRLCLHATRGTGARASALGEAGRSRHPRTDGNAPRYRSRS